MYDAATHPLSVLTSFALTIVTLQDLALTDPLPAVMHLRELSNSDTFITWFVIAAFGTILLVDMVLILLWPTMLRTNRAVILGTTINFMAGLAYVLKLMGPTLVVNDISGRCLPPARFAVWHHTMALMTALLNSLTPVKPQVMCWRLVQTAVCIQAGFAGTLDLGNLPMSLFLVVLSQASLTSLCTSLYQSLRSSKTFAWQRTVLGIFVFVTWHVFPLIWLAGALGFLSEHTEFVLYSLGDVFSKVLITTTMLQGHVKVTSDMLVTDLHVVSAERQMLQEDLKSMIAAAGVPIIVTNALGEVTVWNNQVASISGVSAEEAEASQLWKLPNITPESAEQARLSVSNILKLGAHKQVPTQKDAGAPGQTEAESVPQKSLRPKDSVTFELAFARTSLGDAESIEESSSNGGGSHESSSGAGRSTLILVTASMTHNGDGVPTGLICLGADMTAECERLVVEARRAQAEAVNDTKDKFLACMSHEMRTPLSALIGMLQLVAARPSSEWTHRALYPFMASALRSAEHLFVLVSDVLDMSKVQHGKLSLSVAEFDLCEAIESVADRCRHVLRSVESSDRQIDFIVDIAEGMPLVLRGDSQRIQQVLTNLGTNAIKYTMRGSVCLRVRSEPLKEDSGNFASLLEEANSLRPRRCTPVTLRMQVCDTGVGIPKHALQSIFNLFETVGDMTASAGLSSASGIGLTICKELVHAMNGSLNVESTMGLGSTFTFTLDTLAYEDGLHATTPVVQQPQLPGEAVSGPHMGHSAVDSSRVSGQVMVVEDDDMNRLVIAMFLEEYTLLDAHNGLEAVLLAFHALQQPHDLDIIVMDVNMPMLTGRQATQLIRIMCHGVSSWAEHLPIVALSANAMDVELGRCLEAGMTTCLTKPVPRSLLCSLVQRSITEGRSSGYLRGRAAVENAARTIGTPAPDGVLNVYPLLREFVALSIAALQHGVGVRRQLPNRLRSLLGALAWALDMLEHTSAAETVRAEIGLLSHPNALEAKVEAHVQALLAERAQLWLDAMMGRPTE